MRSIRQPAAAVRLGLGLPSERRHRELYADARQAEIARGSEFRLQQRRRRAHGRARARRPAARRRVRGPAGGAPQGLRSAGCEHLPANAGHGDQHRRNLRDGRPRPPAAADGPARPPTSGCVHLRRAAARLGVAIGGAAQAAAGSRSHDARMEERNALNRHEGRTRAIVEGWAAERARRVRSLGSIRQTIRSIGRRGSSGDSRSKTRQLEERAARRKAEGWRRDRRALDKLKPAFTPEGARARAEDGGGALRALETLQRRLDEFDAQAARLSLGGAGA